MYDHDLRGKVDMFVDVLWRKNLENNRMPFSLPMPAKYDLVIDIVEAKDKTIFRYYYADHDTKTLFWLDNYNMEETLIDIPGVDEPGHISE